MKRTVVIGSWLLLASGCTADLFIGPDTDGGSSSSTTEGDSTSTSTSSTSGGTSEETSTTEAPATTETTTSTSGEPPTTGEETASTGLTETTTTGEGLLCGELGYDVCLEREDCVWLGEPEVGECEASPCVSEAMEECLALEFAGCEEAIDCTWVGKTPEVGDCVLDVCAPCELQEPDICLASPFCGFNEGEMACIPL